MEKVAKDGVIAVEKAKSMETSLLGWASGTGRSFAREDPGPTAGARTRRRGRAGRGRLCLGLFSHPAVHETVSASTSSRATRVGLWSAASTIGRAPF